MRSIGRQVIGRVEDFNVDIADIAAPSTSARLLRNQSNRRWGSDGNETLLRDANSTLKGDHLELYPFLLTDWREWHRLHPDTLVLKPLPGYADRIPEKNEMIRRGLFGEGSAPPGVLRVDNRSAPVHHAPGAWPRGP